MTDSSPAATLDEIRTLMAELPGPDLAAATATATREAQLTKPPGSLGRLEELSLWLAQWQGRHPPRMEHPRIAVFAGNHGIARRGVSAYPSEVTAQMVQNFIAGGAAVNQLAALAEADLRVYELALDQPTADFTEGPAMSEEDCARAVAYGMMAVEAGFDVLALGEMGIANTTSGAAVCLGLFGGSPEDWVGRGTGVDDAGLERKRTAVDKALATNAEAFAGPAGRSDPFQVLRCLGGLELAAIVGAVLAARMARTPVLLDGFTCCAAAAVLFAVDPRALDHCVVSHRSAEAGHGRLLEAIDKRPLFDFDLRLGEASGAALAVQVLKAATACHAGMATFAEAGVSGPEA
ncbi:MAG: nicotinate-nucleotide--dimethylbenzimidazole phosphoribosyltransferase [Kiloniellales bacterium]|nr:nicotinate-nucleotide--dimethylbenzimidazole phosphoribosyltransferase [Kiloniellales bacterium]